MEMPVSTPNRRDNLTLGMTWSACLIVASVSLLSGCPASDPPAGDAHDQTSSLSSPLPAPSLTIIPLDITRSPDSDDSAGGLLVADLNDDGRMDYLITVPGRIAAYSNDGGKLWIIDADLVVGGSSEIHGLPGHHGPGVAAGDVDGDGSCEVLYLTRDGTLHIVDGTTGASESTATPAVPDGAERWELAMIADFRGAGDDRDILLQATNRAGYRTGRYLAAYAFDDLIAGGKPLWTTDDFQSCAHNGARLADIDGDGRDEVLGGDILDQNGTHITSVIPSRSHVDGITVADLRPDLPGLEVVLLEEGDDHVQLLGMGGPIWREHFRRQEPQNTVVGRFKEGSDALYIWCRSRHNRSQRPFIFDAFGNLASRYNLDDVAPADWSPRGIEVIHTIDWTGERTQLACAKERHASGDVALFEPLTGRFVLRIEEQADRLYVADVTGDWREEIIVLTGTMPGDDTPEGGTSGDGDNASGGGAALHVYANPAANPRPDEPRLWSDRNYRRLKQCHNYYSP